jgi:hypothetical protein
MPNHNKLFPPKLIWLPYKFALVCLFLIVSPASVLAQAFGSISGIVTDPTGAAVPSVRVTAIQTETGTKTVVESNGSGAYVFPSMPPANYSTPGSHRPFLLG